MNCYCYTQCHRESYESDIEWIKDTLTEKTIRWGVPAAECWLEDHIDYLKGKYIHSEQHWEIVINVLKKTIKEALVFPNRLYDTDPSPVCPYCPECAADNGWDVVDYPYRRFPYCEIHRPNGVKSD